jgi:hypothetical protein
MRTAGPSSQTGKEGGAEASRHTVAFGVGARLAGRTLQMHETWCWTGKGSHTEAAAAATTTIRTEHAHNDNSHGRTRHYRPPRCSSTHCICQPSGSPRPQRAPAPTPSRNCATPEAQRRTLCQCPGQPHRALMVPSGPWPRREAA